MFKGIHRVSTTERDCFGSVAVEREMCCCESVSVPHGFYSGVGFGGGFWRFYLMLEVAVQSLRM